MIQFDADPRLYLVICNLLLVFSGFISFVPFIKFDIPKPRLFVALLLVSYIITFIAFRLPVIVYNTALNPDENLFTVGAMTLAQKPIYWESVDGCTSGPFNFYSITLFCELFNQPYDYVSGRIIGACLMSGSIILNFLTLRKFFSLRVAALSIFPVVAFLGTSRFPDFVHFSSEHLPIFLLSVMGYCYALVAQSVNIRPWQLFLLGFCAGIVPFAKLQATPIAAFVVFITYWLVYQKTGRQSLRNMLVLTLGGLVVPAMLLVLAVSYDFLDLIWVYYIQHNFSYGSKISVWQGIVNSFSDPLNSLIKIIAGLGLLTGIALVVNRKTTRLTPQLIYVLTLLAGSIFSVYKPGFMFHHYLLLLVFPAAMLFGYFLHLLLPLLNTRLVYTTMGLTLISILGLNLMNPSRNEFITTPDTARPLSISVVGEEILKYTKPNEPLVVWGDEGRYYLQTRRLQGIRWSNSHWGMYSDSLQNLFRKEYIKEFSTVLSPVFIDTHVEEGSFMLRKYLGYETEPELKNLIDTNYHFLREVNQQRVFVRKDRFADVNKENPVEKTPETQ